MANGDKGVRGGLIYWHDIVRERKGRRDNFWFLRGSLGFGRSRARARLTFDTRRWDIRTGTR
jgi:hypothetical protein